MSLINWTCIYHLQLEGQEEKEAKEEDEKKIDIGLIRVKNISIEKLIQYHSNEH